LAWDPWGNGKWAVRAGYGLFYDRTLNGIWENNAFSDPPLVQTTTVTNNGASSLNLFDNYAAGAAGAVPLGPNGLVATGAGGLNQPPAFRAPSYQDYNVSLQHEIMPNTVFELGYVGTKGTHLLGDIDINQPTVAAREAVANQGIGINAIAPYIGYGVITERAPVFTSNYNSLQATLNRRLSHGLQVGVAYTWSKLLTTNPVDRGEATYNTYDLKQSYGLSTLNTPQILSVNYVYQEPFFKSQRGLGWVLGGWEISGIVSMQSGQSQLITQDTDPWALVSTNTSTPACTTPPCPLYPGGLGMTGSTVYLFANQSGSASGSKNVNKFFNTAAFSDAVGNFGNSAPGAVLGPGFQRWDTSLFKNVRFGERVNLQLRLETFNTFNHVSAAGVGTDVDAQPCSVNPHCDGSTSFGTVTGYHIPRELQLGAKITF
jgi:hypothetical protein